MQAQSSDLIASGDVFLWLSGILLVAAMLMTSIRALRIFALLAGLALIVHLIQRDASGITFALAGLFVAANGVQLAMLFNRARSGTMLTEERALFERVLALSDGAQQRRLRDLIDWRDIRQGHLLMEQGQPDPPLFYIARGAAAVEADGRRVGMCGPGDFLGEMSVLSGQRASASVTASEPMRVACFDRDALGQFAREVPDVGSALSGALNRGLAAKLARMNAAPGHAPDASSGHGETSG